MKKKINKKIISKFLVLALLFGLITNITSSTYAAPPPPPPGLGGTSSAILYKSGFFAPIAVAFDSSGRIYVAEYSGRKITRYDADGSNPTTIAAGFLSDIVGIAIDNSNGDIYVAEHQSSIIKKMDANGDNITTLNTAPTDLGFTAGIALDGKGHLYVASFTYGKVFKMNTDGSGVTEINPAFKGSSIIGLTLDNSENVYVSDRDGFIRKIDTNGVVTNFLSGLSNPQWVSRDSNGDLYVSESGKKLIKKVDTSGNILATFNTGNYTPWGSAVDSSGYIYFADMGMSLLKIVGTGVTSDVNKLVLTMNNPLIGAVADPAAFTVHAASAPTVTEAVVAGDTITLTLSKPMAYGENITVDYTKTGTNNLTKGTELASFTGLPVKNNVVGLISVATIANINVANGTKQGDISLPQNTNVVLSNGTTVSSAITWDNGTPAYDGGTAGTYLFTGTLNLPPNVSNTTNKKASVQVIVAPDATIPAITLAGNAKETLVNGAIYTDAGATATDAKDGVITANIVKTITNTAGTIITNVDTKAAGTYVIHYNVKDAAGNAATEITRTVVVLPADVAVKGDVVDKTGKSIKGIEAKVTTEADGTKTVAMQAADTVAFSQPNGTQSAISDTSKLGFSGAEGSNVTVSADGKLQVKNLANGTETKLTITYDLGNGVKINLGTLDIKVDANGVVSVVSTLIDPYGTITDSTTGKVISGVDVKLYYANTARNIAAGKTPGSLVVLPEIAGFKPNDNKNPQVSDASGAYGFMVFPTSDYYIVAKKAGYEDFKSGNIAVESEIVKYDFKMDQQKVAAATVATATTTTSLPKTGSPIDLYTLLALGVILIGAGAVMLSGKKNKTAK